jgi:hypothetical protein
MAAGQAALWMVLSASAMAAIVWLFRGAALHEYVRQRRWRDTSTAFLEAPAAAYVSGIGIGIAAATLILAVAAL